MLTEVGLLAEGEKPVFMQLGPLTHVYSGSRAHKLFNRNVEYIVKDDQDRWIDEHTPSRPCPVVCLKACTHRSRSVYSFR
jgi:hypothetical protein